jgi:uncharacterized protein YlxW (UPF0749 family)
MEHAPPPDGWEQWPIWAFLATVGGGVLTLIKHKTAKVDTAVLQQAHAQNVDMMTQILRAQNQLGDRLGITDKKIDDVKGHMETALSEINERLASIEQRPA